MLPGCMQNLTVAELVSTVLASPIASLAVPKVSAAASSGSPTLPTIARSSQQPPASRMHATIPTCQQRHGPAPAKYTHTTQTRNPPAPCQHPTAPHPAFQPHLPAAHLCPALPLCAGRRLDP